MAPLRFLRNHVPVLRAHRQLSVVAAKHVHIPTTDLLSPTSILQPESRPPGVEEKDTTHNHAARTEPCSNNVRKSASITLQNITSIQAPAPNLSSDAKTPTGLSFHGTSSPLTNASTSLSETILSTTPLRRSARIVTSIGRGMAKRYSCMACPSKPCETAFPATKKFFESGSLVRHASIGAEESPGHSPYWDQISEYRNISVEDFTSKGFSDRCTIRGPVELAKFMTGVLPEDFQSTPSHKHLPQLSPKDAIIGDFLLGHRRAPMAVSITPHQLSLINWKDPYHDPIRRQFITLESCLLENHPNGRLDSLSERADSPVEGLVHRYPGRVLFLALSRCPCYCRFCTRSYAVGPETDLTAKEPQKADRDRWEAMYKYIRNNPDVKDVVVSGGDASFLPSFDLLDIGQTLLKIDHVERIRFASKILSCNPAAIQKGDPWADALVSLSQKGRKLGKQVCLHTHINTANEMTWATKKAGLYLFSEGLIVRNQAVLLKGVNDTVPAMKALIDTLSSCQIQPYYMYQCDMVEGVEDLRTPLRTTIELEKSIRGTVSGFNMPSFVVDLPEGGGKRLVSSYENYDEKLGASLFRAPGLGGSKGDRVYSYHDPRPDTRPLVPDPQTEYTSLQQIIDLVAKEEQERKDKRAKERKERKEREKEEKRLAESGI